MLSSHLIRAAVLFTAALVIISSAHAADKPKEAQVGLERKLHGAWRGPACGGDWTFAADGTFDAEHFSPGGSTLSGTWEVRWDALPPTLVRTCKTSDDPDLVGKKWESRLIELGDEALAYQDPDQYPSGHVVRYTRLPRVLSAEIELAALQGTWIPLQNEEGGNKVQGELNFKQIIKGDKVTFQVNGETKAEGKVVLNPAKSPQHLDFQFTSGQTDLIIYVRAGDYITYCGNRDGKTRPSEFTSGTAKGGEYLMVWKIER
jgi:uncharacterized protein (TIGR03067 family)